MIANTLWLALALGLAADKDLEPLQGTWQMEKLVGRGKEIDGERARAISFVFEGNTLRRFVNGEDRKDPATITIDAAKSPAHFDLATGKKNEPTMLGIYEINDDTLKWCFSAKKRPDKFESPDGSDVILMVLKRKK